MPANSPDSTSNPLVLKLERGVALSAVEKRALNALVSNSRIVGDRQDLISEGENPKCVRLIMEGLAYRYKALPGGQRQIMALLVPGDFCDVRISLLREMDHSVGTLTKCRVVEIPNDAIERITAAHPGIRRAFWWATLVDEAILREWLVGMGQRPADQRLAHLFCELHVRFKTVGLAPASSFDLPLSQIDLGDVLGLSPVHVNRVLQSLRSQQLIAFNSGKVVIPDVGRLRKLAGFDDAYLHYDALNSATATPQA